MAEALWRNLDLWKPAFLGRVPGPGAGTGTGTGKGTGGRGAPKGLQKLAFCRLDNFLGGWRMWLAWVRECEHYLQEAQFLC